MKSPVLVSAPVAHEIAHLFDAVIAVVERDLNPVFGAAAPDHVVMGFGSPPGEGAASDLAAEAVLWRAIRFARQWIAGDMQIHGDGDLRHVVALGLVILADWSGPGTEVEAVQQCRDLRPAITPNRRIVALGDRVLRRDGALLEALEVFPHRCRRRGAGLNTTLAVFRRLGA